MLDTHAVARALTNAEFTPAQADAITDAVRQAAEQGDHVTSEQFKTGLAELRTELAEHRAEVRTEIANLDMRLSTQIAELGGQIAEQRADVRTEIANLDMRLSTQIAELGGQIAEQRADVRTEIANLDTRLAGVRTEVANLETRLIRWMVGTVLATATLTVAILRLLGLAPSS